MDEVWHNSKDFNALEGDAFGMALQGMHKE